MKEGATVRIEFKQRHKEYRVSIGGHGRGSISLLKEALSHAPDDTAEDLYGSGSVVNDFEEKIAKLLGKEEARFYPSGTMAQQNALRVHCDKRGVKSVVLHPFCHLEEREHYGIQELNQIKTILVGDETRIYDLDDIKGVQEEYSAVVIELPARDFGGEMPTFQELVEMRDYLKERGVKFHLDGARLWEAQPYYDRPLAEICGLFDSVYVSFYKGIGSVTGAILAGESSFIEECKVWQRRYGGNLFNLYPFVIAAEYYFDQRVSKMRDYWEGAKEFCQNFNEIEGFSTLPTIPKSNLFHIYIEREPEEIESLFDRVYSELAIRVVPALVKRERGFWFEISIGDDYLTLDQKSRERLFEILGQK